MTVRNDSLLKQHIVFVYMKNPKTPRREIASLTGAKYGTVRNVISRYVRGEVTKRSAPSLGFSVHGWFWSGLWGGDLVVSLRGKGGLYAACPSLVVDDNRNGMKRFVGETFSFILHKGGRVAIYPFVDEEPVWRAEILVWLKNWILEEGLAEALLKEANLKQVGSKSWAVHTPGVPSKICFRVKGIGSLKTDPTPYPDGTAEFELDPLLDKRLRGIEASILSVVGILEGLSRGLGGLNGNGVSKPIGEDYSS